MIGTSENPLAVPYDGISRQSSEPATPLSQHTLSSLQPVTVNPPPHFPEWTMWKTDGKGHFEQVTNTDQITSTTFIAKDGRLMNLPAHPLDSASVAPKTGLALFTQHIMNILKKAA
jgi:hypothetical protein